MNLLSAISNNKKGLSLIEILVTMGIFIIVIIMAGDFIVTGFRATRFESEQDMAIQSARNGLDVISREVRGANQSEQGDYPLARIEEEDFIYYADVDDDGLMERVRYYLIGTNLYRVVTEPGPLGNYSTTPATTTISQYMNNQDEPIFSYFDNNYDETSIINQVRLIKAYLVVNVTPTVMPNDYIVETDVHLRNLKDNL